MRLVLILTLVVLFGGVAIVAASDDGRNRVRSECEQATLLVKFRPDADAVAAIARHGLMVVSTDLVAAIGVYELAAPPGTVQEKLAALEADRAVEFAELNQTYSVPEASPPATGVCGG